MGGARRGQRVGGRQPRPAARRASRRHAHREPTQHGLRRGREPRARRRVRRVAPGPESRHRNPPRQHRRAHGVHGAPSPRRAGRRPPREPGRLAAVHLPHLLHVLDDPPAPHVPGATPPGQPRHPRPPDARLRPCRAARGRLGGRRLHARAPPRARGGRADGRALLHVLRGCRLVRAHASPRLGGLVRARVGDGARLPPRARPPASVAWPGRMREA